MKVFLILTIIGGTVSEAPYPPSGWRPKGPAFELPSISNQKSQLQQQYGGPNDGSNGQQSQRSGDLSTGRMAVRGTPALSGRLTTVQGLPVHEAANFVQASDRDGVQVQKSISSSQEYTKFGSAPQDLNSDLSFLQQQTTKQQKSKNDELQQQQNLQGKPQKIEELSENGEPQQSLDQQYLQPQYVQPQIDQQLVEQQLFYQQQLQDYQQQLLDYQQYQQYQLQQQQQLQEVDDDDQLDDRQLQSKQLNAFGRKLQKQQFFEYGPPKTTTPTAAQPQDPTTEIPDEETTDAPLQDGPSVAVSTAVANGRNGRFSARIRSSNSVPIFTINRKGDLVRIY